MTLAELDKRMELAVIAAGRKNRRDGWVVSPGEVTLIARSVVNVPPVSLATVCLLISEHPLLAEYDIELLIENAQGSAPDLKEIMREALVEYLWNEADEYLDENNVLYEGYR